MRKVAQAVSAEENKRAEMMAELLELERNHDALLQERDQLCAQHTEAEGQADRLRTLSATVCDSVLGALPSLSLLETQQRQLPEAITDQRQRVARRASFYGSQVALGVVVSHHKSINLEAVEEGYLGGLPEEDVSRLTSGFTSPPRS